MFKMLGCLAGAMTATSALLGWMDPSPPLPDELPSLEDSLTTARALVAEHVDVRSELWRGIDILPGMPAGNYLTAVRDSETCEFYIDLEGAMHRTGRWSRQAYGGAGPRPVGIRVALSGERQPMTRVQWRRLQALVTTLRETLDEENQTEPIRLRSEWAAVYDVRDGESLSFGSGEKPNS